MFTGIVEEIGVVRAIKREKRGISLEVRNRKISSDVKIGDSIAINGACLSVTSSNFLILYFVLFDNLFFLISGSMTLILFIKPSSASALGALRYFFISINSATK
ncbi:hypothetical protein ACFL28_04700 [Candidatus Omnitrophota bacterium]